MAAGLTAGRATPAAEQAAPEPTRGARWGNWRWPLAIAALVGWSALLWLPSLDLPLHVDAGGYALAAYWWARGDTLYQDFTITRPQGIFVVFRAIQALGLGSVRGIHLAAAGYAALSALALLAVAARVWGQWVGLGAVALFAALLVTPYLEGYSANAELFMLPPLLGSLYLLIRADDRPLGARRTGWLLAGSGLLAAVAVLVKPSAVAMVALGGLWLLRRWRVERAGWRAWLVSEGAFAAGIALGLLPALAHGLATAPEVYLTAVLLYRTGEDSIVGGAALYQLAYFVAHTMTILAHVPILLLAGLGLWGAGRDAGRGERRQRDLLGLWTLTSLGGLALGGNWWYHYYQQLLPPLAIAVILGAHRLLRGPDRPTRPARAAWVGLLAMAVAGGLVLAWTVASILTPPADPAKLIYDYQPAFSATGAVAEYLRERTGPEERIYVAYHQPEIYYLAERRPAARWLYFRELKKAPGGFAEQVARLANPATAPRYVVEAQPFDHFGFDQDGALRAVIAHNYTPETTIGGMTIYRRVGP